jgi:hypothetical protein
MVLGEQAIDIARSHLSPPAHNSDTLVSTTSVSSHAS